LYWRRVATLRDLRAQMADEGWPLPLLPWPLREMGADVDVDMLDSPVNTDEKETHQ
jgi:hypothetical protein